MTKFDIGVVDTKSFTPDTNYLILYEIETQF